MKKLLSIVLGLTVALGTATLTFAQGGDAPKEGKKKAKKKKKKDGDAPTKASN